MTVGLCMTVLKPSPVGTDISTLSRESRGTAAAEEDEDEEDDDDEDDAEDDDDEIPGLLKPLMRGIVAGATGSAALVSFFPNFSLISAAE